MSQHRILPNKAAARGRRPKPVVRCPLAPRLSLLRNAPSPLEPEPSTRGRETTAKLAASLLPGRPQSRGQGKAGFKSQLLRSQL